MGVAQVTNCVTGYNQRSNIALASNIALRGIICTVHYKERFSFESWHVVWVAKRLKEYWFIVLW